MPATHTLSSGPEEGQLSLDECMSLRRQREETRCTKSVASFDSPVLSQKWETFDERQQYLSGSGFLYKHAIRLPADLQMENTHCATVASAVIVFNLALAYQLRSAELRNPSSKRSLVSKAGRLCELGLQVLPDTTSAVMFILATLNNLRLVHRELNDSTSANMCFEHLMSTLMVVVDNLGVEGCMDCDELDGFLRNATTANFQAQPAAAA